MAVDLDMPRFALPAILALLTIIAAPIVSDAVSRARAEVRLNAVQAHALCVVETAEAQRAAGEYVDTRACR